MSNKPKKPHTPVKMPARLPWLWCPRCGLVYLRNDVTAKAIKAGCPDEGD